MDRNNVFWYIFLVITFLVWGTQHPPIKILSGEMGPFLFNFLRFFIAGAVLLPFVMKTGWRSRKRFDFDIYSWSCRNLPFRVFNIFGVRMSTAVEQRYSSQFVAIAACYDCADIHQGENHQKILAERSLDLLALSLSSRKAYCRLMCCWGLILLGMSWYW